MAAGPPLRARLIGTTTSYVIALAPRAWPLLAGPTQRFWDKVAASWDTGASPSRTVALEAACQALPASPARVLEIGCGTGDATSVLVERFPAASVTAVDISQEMLASARAKLAATGSGRVSFERADASSLPFEDGSFDLVAQNNMPAFTREVARVLAPGGHAIFASAIGSKTPYHTPHRLLSALLERRGIRTVTTGTAGPGSYLVACRPG